MSPIFTSSNYSKHLLASHGTKVACWSSLPFTGKIFPKIRLLLFCFERFSIQKCQNFSENHKIFIFGFQYVGKNIKGWLKIRISCLVCSQIWLTFLRMMATFSTSSSGWLSLWLQEKDSYENHWTAEASNLFSMQRKPDPILEVPRIQNKLTSNSPTTSGEKRKERSPWCTKILFWLQG